MAIKLNCKICGKKEDDRRYIFKSKELDRKMVADYIENHTLSYSSTIFPIWTKCCGVLDHYKTILPNRKNKEEV